MSQTAPLTLPRSKDDDASPERGAIVRNSCDTVITIGPVRWFVCVVHAAGSRVLLPLSLRDQVSLTPEIGGES